MNEKRQYHRVPAASATFVELEAPGIDKDEAGRVVVCKSLDVSRGGLQVVLVARCRLASGFLGTVAACRWLIDAALFYGDCGGFFTSARATASLGLRAAHSVGDAC